MRELAGRFIVVDGPDGAGKSTQIARLGEWLAKQGVDVRLTRDPGGTDIGDRVRQILLDRAAAEMAVACETMLYMASRAQLVAEVVRPALAAGRCVLCDRFVSATVAYQGAGGANVNDIMTVANVAVGDTWPDLTILLDIDADAGLSRVPRGLDRMEAKGLAFHRAVRELFLRQAAADPKRFTVVNAAGSEEEVAARMRETVMGWQFQAEG